MKKVFIVEDDPLMVRMYERIFKTNGYEVETAFDGEEALAKIQIMKDKPTIILLDVMMPKLSGFDVLKRIKTMDDLKNIPVVLLTNLSGKEDAERGISLGAADYMVKSEYEPKQVVSRIEDIISKTSK